ncbi:unnamed protein product [Clavelina lepadiformis]|uniref:Uncharacterized protein n=1 Tax=Clavelina lepadiformis TaxID=159417 RepID=A0ABP0EYM5_CLALP
MASPAINVYPERSMFDEKAHITIKGFIDLCEDQSVGGTFTGVEPMGLFWAMVPSPLNKRPHARLMQKDVTTPMLVKIRVLDIMIESVEELHQLRKKNELERHELIVTEVRRLFMAPGTKRKTYTVQEDGFHGTLFIPPGDGPFPGVISMFGGFPGVVEFKAALLASHGFATLALAFFGVPGLVTGLESPLYLDLEYFEKVVDFMRKQPCIDGRDGIGVIGLSMSTLVALRMAEFLPGIRCVVCINGFTMGTFPGIKYKNISIPPMDCSVLYFPGAPLDSILSSRNLLDNLIQNADHDDIGIKIDFYNKHNISFLFIAGLDDDETPSEFCLNHAEKMLKAAKHPDYKLLRYPATGHSIEPPYGNHTRISASVDQTMRSWGGLAHIHCKAQEDAWLKQIQFLRENLTRDFSPKL